MILFDSASAAVLEKARNKPVHRFDQESSVSDMLYAKTLRSTDKKMTAEGEDDPCDWDKDGTQDCAVTVRALIDIEDTGVVEANVSSTTLNISRRKGNLNLCITNLLKDSFSEINVHGNMYSPLTTANFIEGLPSLIYYGNEVRKYIGIKGVDPGAITLGPTIYYPAGQINMNSPTWGQLEMIIEEVSHLEQFYNLWASNFKNDIQEIGNRGQIQHIRRAPNLVEAQISWAVNYVNAYLSVPEGNDPYTDNSVEAPAKSKASSVVTALRIKYADRNSPCN
jgi:hypothetical protein